MSDDLVTRGKFPTPINKMAVAQDWRARGYGCDLFVDPPGQEWLGFVHATNELVTVVDGLLEVSVDGKVAVLEPGDEVFIPRNGVHDVTNRSNGVTRWLYGYD